MQWNGYFKTEGIVLNNIAFAEADELVTIITKKLGKVNCIIKGIRKSKKRPRNAVDICSRVELLLYKRNDLSMPIIHEVDIIDQYLKNKENLANIVLSYYFLDLVRNFVGWEEITYNVYYLLLNGLESLTKNINKSIFSRAFELKISLYSGLTSMDFYCDSCNKLISGSAFFNKAGHFFDSKCLNSDQDYMQISEKAIDLMNIFKKRNLSELRDIQISNIENMQLRSYFMIVINNYVNKKIFSIKILRQLYEEI